MDASRRQRFAHDRRRPLQALVLVCCLLLAGCYTLTEPVLDKGERAPIAGRFTCSDAISGSPSPESFTERKTGFFFPDYRYEASDGSEMALRRMDGKFYLAQVRFKNGLLQAGFVELLGEKELVLFIPNIIARGEDIQALANKSKINLSFTDRGAIRLIGDRGKVLDFLLAHDRSMLSVQSNCARVE